MQFKGGSCPDHRCGLGVNRRFVWGRVKKAVKCKDLLTIHTLRIVGKNWNNALINPIYQVASLHNWKARWYLLFPKETICLLRVQLILTIIGFLKLFRSSLRLTGHERFCHSKKLIPCFWFWFGYDISVIRNHSKDSLLQWVQRRGDACLHV